MSIEKEDRQDEQWLSALGGNPDQSADPMLNAEASALRNAIRARNDRLASQVPDLDDELREKILFRLRREGLIGKRNHWGAPQIGALAAAITLGIALTVHMQGVNKIGHEDIYRGGGTVLIVEDVETRLSELLDLLRHAGEQPSVERKGDGRILVRFRATAEVLDALSVERIEPEIKNGSVVIELQPAARRN